MWLYTQWWVPSLNLEACLQPELWDISVSGLLSQALVRFDKGLEDLEASVVLGSVEHRPNTGLMSAD